MTTSTEKVFVYRDFIIVRGGMSGTLYSAYLRHADHLGGFFWSTDRATIESTISDYRAGNMAAVWVVLDQIRDDHEALATELERLLSRAETGEQHAAIAYMEAAYLEICARLGVAPRRLGQ